MFDYLRLNGSQKSGYGSQNCQSRLPSSALRYPGRLMKGPYGIFVRPQWKKPMLLRIGFFH